MKIQGSVALVTGANRGIGKALVTALVDAGASKVYAAARDTSSIVGSDKVIPLTLDVTDAASVAAAAEKAKDVTLLINNAGVLEGGAIAEADQPTVDRHFAVNFHGKRAMVAAFAPAIEENGGGAIVNLLTLIALASMPGFGVYNASKAAAWSMTQSIRADLGKKGIAVHGVFPGAVDTDMLAGVEMDKTKPEDVANAIVEGVEAGEEDIFPDPMSTAVYGQWKVDHKAVEHQFSAY
tara:strand:- start:11387 stop:12097 length:711 start_codon:yes stop_codon:yes gene_type:complete